MPNFRYGEHGDAIEAFPDASYRTLVGENEDTALWLGVELELDIRKNTFADVRREEGRNTRDDNIINHWRNLAVDRANKAIGEFCIMKPEGSVPHGFEINSVPGTLGWHKRAWKDFFRDAEDYLVADDRAGIHIHLDVERAGGQKSVARYAGFINAEQNRRFVTAIAGRGNIGTCAYHSHPDDAVDAASKENQIQQQGYFSCGSVRMNHDGDTAEARIFAATTDWRRFASRIEFVDAAARFTRAGHETQGPGTPLSMERFLSWVRSGPRIEAYPSLLRELRRIERIEVPA